MGNFPTIPTSDRDHDFMALVAFEYDRREQGNFAAAWGHLRPVFQRAELRPLENDPIGFMDFMSRYRDAVDQWFERNLPSVPDDLDDDSGNPLLSIGDRAARGRLILRAEEGRRRIAEHIEACIALEGQRQAEAAADEDRRATERRRLIEEATDADRALAAETLIECGADVDVLRVVARLGDDSLATHQRALRIIALIRGASLLVVLPTPDNPAADPAKATFCPLCAEPLTHCEGHGRRTL